MSILICDPDMAWSEKVRKYFTQLNLIADIANNGKECQLKIYKNKYECVILDIDTVHHSGAEVLKFIRLNFPMIRVVMTVSSSKRLDELQIAKEDLSNMGVSTLLVKPYGLDKILSVVEEQNFHSSWKSIIENDVLEEELEVTAQDNEFTKIDLHIMSLDNAAIFDCYVRLTKNKYIKIFNRGDIFNKERIAKHFASSKDKSIYFKTKDRSVYINFMNDFILKTVKSNEATTSKKVLLAKSLTEKYIEEVYTKGLHPQLMNEGKKVCENMYDIILGSKDLAILMRDYRENGNDDLAHCFLTSFFSVMIAKNLNWKSSRTIEAVALGGLIHDIGKLKLDRKIRSKKVSELTDFELAQYKRHPELGADLLQNCPGISESVIQIVYQHHEFMGGDGFPNKLSGGKIYPLAKVVGLANAFVHDMIELNTNPLDTIKALISNRNKVLRFDPIIVKALISSFIKSEEK